MATSNGPIRGNWVRRGSHMKKWTLPPLQIAPHGRHGCQVLVRPVVAGGMGRGCPDTMFMCSVAAEDAN